MLVSELERLHQAQRFINRAANRQVVDRNLTENALLVDDEEAATEGEILEEVHSVKCAHRNAMPASGLITP